MDRFQGGTVFKDLTADTFHPVRYGQRNQFRTISEAAVFQTHAVQGTGIIYLRIFCARRYPDGDQFCRILSADQIQYIIDCPVITAILRDQPGNEGRILLFPRLVISQIRLSLLTGRDVDMHALLARFIKNILSQCRRFFTVEGEYLQTGAPEGSVLQFFQAIGKCRLDQAGTVLIGTDADRAKIRHVGPAGRRDAPALIKRFIPDSCDRVQQCSRQREASQLLTSAAELVRNLRSSSLQRQGDEGSTVFEHAFSIPFHRGRQENAFPLRRLTGQGSAAGKGIIPDLRKTGGRQTGEIHRPQRSTAGKSLLADALHRVSAVHRRQSLTVSGGFVRHFFCSERNIQHARKGSRHVMKDNLSRIFQTVEDTALHFRLYSIGTYRQGHPALIIGKLFFRRPEREVLSTHFSSEQVSLRSWQPQSGSQADNLQIFAIRKKIGRQSFYGIRQHQHGQSLTGMEGVRPNLRRLFFYSKCSV